jgi:hypothetical protein
MKLVTPEIRLGATYQRVMSGQTFKAIMIATMSDANGDSGVLYMPSYGVMQFTRNTPEFGMWTLVEGPPNEEPPKKTRK